MIRRSSLLLSGLKPLAIPPEADNVILHVRPDDILTPSDDEVTVLLDGIATIGWNAEPNDGRNRNPTHGLNSVWPPPPDECWSVSVSFSDTWKWCMTISREIWLELMDLPFHSRRVAHEQESDWFGVMLRLQMMVHLLRGMCFDYRLENRKKSLAFIMGRRLYWQRHK